MQETVYEMPWRTNFEAMAAAGWVAGAMGIWKDPRGVTAAQVANAKLQAANRIATSAEVQTTRKQLLALHKLQLLTKQKVSNADYFSIRG